MSDKLGFFDSLFDVNGDGKVDDMDFIDDMAIFHMMQEDEKKEQIRREEQEFEDLDDELEDLRNEKRELMESLGLDPDDYDDDELDELDEDDIEYMAEEALGDLADEEEIDDLADDLDDDLEDFDDEEESVDLDDLDEQIALTIHSENATLINYHWAGMSMLPLFVDKAKEVCEFEYDYGNASGTYGLIWAGLLYVFVLDQDIGKQRRIDLYNCLCDKLCLELSGGEGEDVFGDQNDMYKQFPDYIEGVFTVLALASLIADTQVTFSDYVRVFQVLAESASEDAEGEYQEVRNHALSNMICDIGTAAWERAQAKYDEMNKG